MTQQAKPFGKIATIAVALLLVALSWYRPIEVMAESQLSDGLKRALVSFASARALNGVISVVQGTQVAVEPLGVGVSLSVGEILDPINDLVEAFSTVMLTASVAFGMQLLLLSLGSSWMVSAAVTGIAVLWALLYFLGKSPHWLSRLLLVLLFIRFVIPVATIGSAAVFDRLLKQDYEANQQAIDLTSQQLKTLSNASTAVPPEPVPGAPADGKSTWEKLKDSVTGTASAISGTFTNPLPKALASYEELKQAAERAAEKMITLMVIFLMQTIVLPLILVWGLYRLSAGALAPRAGDRN
jgi:hypothetical protein